MDGETLKNPWQRPQKVVTAAFSARSQIGSALIKCQARFNDSRSVSRVNKNADNASSRQSLERCSKSRWRGTSGRAPNETINALIGWWKASTIGFRWLHTRAGSHRHLIAIVTRFKPENSRTKQRKQTTRSWFFPNRRFADENEAHFSGARLQMISCLLSQTGPAFN